MDPHQFMQLVNLVMEIFAMDKERFFSKKRFERSIAPFNFLRIIRQSNLTIQHRLQ